MPQESERPRPHGDPMEDEIVEPNPAQRQTDATPDVATTGLVEDPVGISSTANGIPPFDETDGEIRRKLYEKGAELVSRID